MFQHFLTIFDDYDDHDDNGDDGDDGRERAETEIEFVWNFLLLFPPVPHCFPCYSIEIEFVRNISTLFPQPNSLSHSIKLQHLHSWRIKAKCWLLSILCFKEDFVE